MQIDLVFPPFDYSVLIPEIGVPVLKANLERAGHEVRQADLNVELISGILSGPEAHVGLLEALSLPERGDSTTFLESLAWELCRVRGIRPPRADSLLELAKERERSMGKTCQFGREPDPPGWVAQPGGPVEGALGTMVRHWREGKSFGRDLLRVIHHFYFTPPTYGVDDVIRAAHERNAFLEPFYEERLGAMWSRCAPSILGISIWSTSQLVPALVLARKARDLLGDVKIIAGGAWCTYARDLLPEVPELFELVDAFAVHEADATLAEAARALEQGGDPGGIPGLVTPAGASPPRPPSRFEDLELPVYDGFPLEMYPLPRLALRLFRGCYWSRCVFCTHACHPYTRRFSFRKGTRLSVSYLDRVRAHVEDVRDQHGIRQFTIADNLIPPTVMKQLADLNIEAGLGIEWDSLARFEREYTTAFCDHIARGGCVQLDLGLETADDEALGRINKGITLGLVERNLRNLTGAGIRTKVFVLNYVGQRPEEYERTLEFLANHADVISEVAISRFSLSRGTLPFSSPGELGIRVEPEAGRDLDVFCVPFSAEERTREAEVVEITRRYFPGYW